MEGLATLSGPMEFCVRRGIFTIAVFFNFAMRSAVIILGWILHMDTIWGRALIHVQVLFEEIEYFFPHHTCVIDWDAWLDTVNDSVTKWELWLIGTTDIPYEHWLPIFIATAYDNSTLGNWKLTVFKVCMKLYFALQSVGQLSSTKIY